MNSSFAETQARLTIGSIARVEPGGVLWVDYRGNPLGPALARTTIAAAEAHLAVVDAPVLLWFQDDDPSLPVIVGLVKHKLLPARTSETAIERERETLVFDASREIVLRCGMSSLTLRRDGKVLMKGTSLVSHATVLNRIKGASVQIN